MGCAPKPPFRWNWRSSLSFLISNTCLFESLTTAVGRSVCGKMKAVVVTTSGKLSLRKVEDPPAAAIVDDEVLIKVAATALNRGEVPVDGPTVRRRDPALTLTSSAPAPSSPAAEPSPTGKLAISILVDARALVMMKAEGVRHWEIFLLKLLGAESAIVFSQFFSGTHAITCALFAFLRPGDELLAVAGAPYDNLEEVIGIKNSSQNGSLKDFGVAYREVPLAEDGGLDWDAIGTAERSQTKCGLIQRSCGYLWRQILSVPDIQRAMERIKL